MRNELLFWGIDAGYIDKKEACKCKGTINICNCRIPINLPETKGSVKIDDKFKENNWELFRINRRCMMFNPCTCFICHDDIKRLIKEMQVNKSNLNSMLDEAAYFGSIKCFRYLMINGANPSDKTMKRACHSGNEEILQMLVEKGIKLSMDCLDSAMAGWRNALVHYIIEKIQDGLMDQENVNGALIQAARYSNYSMVLLFIEKGANVNAQTDICQITFQKLL